MHSGIISQPVFYFLNFVCFQSLDFSIHLFNEIMVIAFSLIMMRDSPANQIKLLFDFTFSTANEFRHRVSCCAYEKIHVVKGQQRSQMRETCSPTIFHRFMYEVTFPS